MTCVASASVVQLWYVQEDGTGAIPASPVWKPIRYNEGGNSLAYNAERIESEEVRGDRHKTADRRGLFSVAGDITCQLAFGALDDLIEAAFCGTWTADVLKTGTTRRTFAILERHTDKSIDYLYRGCEVNTWELSGTAGEKWAVTFGILGKTQEKLASLPAGSTFAAVTTTDFMTALDGDVLIDAASYGYVFELTSSIDNGIEQIYAVGNNSAICSTIAPITAGGTLNAYFDSATYYDKFLNNTAFALELQMTDGTDTYTLTVPKATAVSGQKQASGSNVVVNTEYSAGYDSVELTEIKLVRT